MADNRINELRTARDITLEELAERVGLSQGHLSRLENGKRLLLVPVAEKIAVALGVSVAEVLGISHVPPAERRPVAGLSEDFTPYVPGPNDPFAGLAGNGHYLFEIHTTALDKAGVAYGDIAVVSDAKALCANPPPLSKVRVRLHPRENFMKPVTLLRQFVPPKLLITNSTHGNEPSIDMDEDDAHIVGVVLSVHRSLVR